jgi:hypothetical protein
MKDNTVQIIEVKGDNKLNDPVVRAKQAAAIELATESNNIEYLMLPGNFIMKNNIFETTTDKEFAYDQLGEDGYGSQMVADLGERFNDN